MKVSKLLMPTIREVPAEAEIVSHRLMLRAALIRKLAAGVYSYLPLGLRTLRNVEQVIREEMDKAGAQELLMSALLPAEAYMQTGRWDIFGSSMFRLKDRNDRDFCLGPTHEEIFTETVKNEVRSYKELPMTLYQIQTKYRDERRPRFGVMRSREFVMKDAYSFDLTQEGLDASYDAMYKAYCAIFDRLGLDYIVVDADSGAMGGSGSQEFMVKSEVGEDIIAFCESCGYAANEEKAVCHPQKKEYPTDEKPMEKMETPDAHTIEELTSFLNVPAYRFAKTLIYKVGEQYVAVMVRGDREVNPVKVQNLLGSAEEAELAEAFAVRDITGAEVGFAGPVGLSIPVYADHEVMEMKQMVVGANETGYHFVNVEPGRDFTPAKVADLRTVVSGDVCPKCGGRIETVHGIEIGHIFKLGTKYSKALGLTFPDENGEEQPVIMGCYGIGVNRCIAAVIEQNNDENGIIWPMCIAPYKVEIVVVNVADETQMRMAQQLYDMLQENGVETLWDERSERPGVKFKDADLIGIPVRITVGKKAAEGIVEFKKRAENTFSEMSFVDAAAEAIRLVGEAKK
ncbi:MAG: proline--tRNA ligase [Ruminococcaceae bacterium]|nr:proline--tRNA ligase [Oscillospiraceae bacterium]